MGKLKGAAKKSLIVLIKGYSRLVSPFLGSHCRFYPSCSLYAQIAIERHGILLGLWLSFRRILRCHPWCQSGYDPVPEEKATRRKKTVN